MAVISWVVYAVALFITVSSLAHIRYKTSTGEGVPITTINGTLLFVISLIVIPAWGFSPFHVLWVFPASYILGSMSLMLPFSILSILGRPLGFLVCLGLDQDEIRKRQERVSKMQEIVYEEGCSFEEAREILIERGEW